MDKVLVLRTCDANMGAYGGFVWPESGHASAPDWLPRVECGNGLHGLLWGEGDGSHLNWDEGAKWLVVEVEANKIVDLDGKVKFPDGQVIYCGDREGATRLIQATRSGAIAGLTVSVDARNAIAITGYRGTASAGNYGTASAGEGGTASAGYRGTASAGNYGTASAGEGGTASAGYRGTASAGYRGTASAGNYGTASAGEGGTASAGNYGTASAGYRGTASAGNYGTASAGEGGLIEIATFDGKRMRKLVGYVGENDIQAGVKYQLKNGIFVPVSVSE